MERLLQDLSYAARMLLKQPLISAVAVIALALGIGASTAIFSVVNAVLIEPLPFSDPDRLVMVWERNLTRSRDQNVLSPKNFFIWKEESRSFESLSALMDRRATLTGKGEPEEVAMQYATVDFFSTLGVQAAFGRTFAASEGEPSQDHVVILSHALWMRRFGGERGVVGQSIHLNGEPYTVIGVMPPGFRFYRSPISPGETQLWIPMGFSAEDRQWRGRFLTSVGRLKQDIPLQQVRAEMDGIAERLEQAEPERMKGWRVNVVPIREQLSGGIQPTLLVLLGAVGFMLLIACANVANLLLARTAARQRELAIRAALGAGRARIIRQLLTECLLIAALGGGLGLLLALWGTELLLGLGVPDTLPLRDVGLDLRVLGFALAVSALTAVVFGLAPALEASRPEVTGALKEGTKGTTGVRGAKLRNALVVAEVAISLTLLIGAGLMIRSFMRLQDVDPGFRAEGQLTFRVQLPPSQYEEEPKRAALFDQLVTSIQALPGVASVGANDYLPLAGEGSATGFTIEGEAPRPPGEEPGTDVRVATTGYFQTMGIPLKKGRIFTEKEQREMSHVVVISEKLAHQYFPGQDPIGRRITIVMRAPEDLVPSEIIGIVGDVRHSGLDQDVRSTIYWPLPELPPMSMTVVARTSSDPASLIPAVRETLRRLDPDLPIADISTVNGVVAASMVKARFSTLLMSVFAGLALLLATVGLYGVMAFSVTQRTREIGVRLALGAAQWDILRTVLGRSLGLTLVGVGIGVVTAFGLTRLLSSQLYEVSATDPLTFGALSALLTGVALLASYLPARRAMRVDPVSALRSE